MAFDKKYDDGLPFSGTVIARRESVGADDSQMDTGGWCVGLGVGTTYKIPNPTGSRECTLRIEVEDYYQ